MDKTELLKQLKIDLKQGEGQYTEFKDYDFDKLSQDKYADEKKGDLGIEIAAFASTGGTIYIGINDNKTVVGVKGSKDQWVNKLIKRSLGGVQPIVVPEIELVDYKGKSVLMIQLDKGEPIYYYNWVGRYRNVNESVKAPPEVITKRFREYFSELFTPLAAKEEGDSGNNNAQQIVNRIINILLTIKVHTRLYEDKLGEYKDSMDFYLNSTKDEISSLLFEVKKEFGQKSNEYIQLKAIKDSISNVLSHMHMLGGESWNEYKSKMIAVQTKVEELRTTLFQNKKINIGNMDDLTLSSLEEAKEWLEGFDMYHMKEFRYEADKYFNKIYLAAFAKELINEDATELLALADEIQKSCWVRTNVDAQELIKNIPIFIKTIEAQISKYENKKA